VSREPKRLAEGLGFTEGPAWLGDGRVLFTSVAGSLYEASGGEVVRKVLDTGNGPTGLALGPDGAVYVASASGIWGAPGDRPGGIHRYAEGRLERVLEDEVSAPNDLCFGPDGLLYFTDPQNHERGLSEPVPGDVFRYDLESGRLERLHHGGLFPNGLGFDPSGELLYVAQSFAKRIVSYRVGPGGLFDETVLCELEAIPDSLAIDADGNVWQCVNATDAVLVFDPRGKLVDRLDCGEGSYPSNCCFGGADLTTLYVTNAGQGGLLEFDLGVKGLPLYPR
jgi:gluconolactonase